MNNSLNFVVECVFWSYKHFSFSPEVPKFSDFFFVSILKVVSCFLEEEISNVLNAPLSRHQEIRAEGHSKRTSEL